MLVNLALHCELLKLKVAWQCPGPFSWHGHKVNSGTEHVWTKDSQTLTRFTAHVQPKAFGAIRVRNKTADARINSTLYVNQCPFLIQGSLGPEVNDLQSCLFQNKPTVFSPLVWEWHEAAVYTSAPEIVQHLFNDIK